MAHLLSRARPVAKTRPVEVHLSRPRAPRWTPAAPLLDSRRGGVGAPHTGSGRRRHGTLPLTATATDIDRHPPPRRPAPVAARDRGRYPPDSLALRPYQLSIAFAGAPGAAPPSSTAPAHRRRPHREGWTETCRSTCPRAPWEWRSASPISSGERRPWSTWERRRPPTDRSGRSVRAVGRAGDSPHDAAAASIDPAHRDLPTISLLVHCVVNPVSQSPSHPGSLGAPTQA